MEITLIKRLMLALTLVTIFNANASAGGHSKDIVDTAVTAGTFNTLVAATKAAGLVDTLKSEGPFTLFAPTDEAFAALPAGSAAKASSVGAKRVNGPSLLSVSTSPAAFVAATNVLKLPAATAVSTMSFECPPAKADEEIIEAAARVMKYRRNIIIKSP